MIMKSSTHKDSKKEKIPFLDTFWSLAEEDPAVRARAGKDLIVHCFPFAEKTSSDDENNLNAKDAAYALRRLLDGLCSGRASARQGFASCLSSFLAAAQSKPGRSRNAMESTMTEFQENRKESENTKDETVQEPTSFHVWLRWMLLESTDSTAAKDSQQKNRGRKKPSEERDCAFGRLFGILAIIRSGVLQDAPQDVSCFVFP